MLTLQDFIGKTLSRATYKAPTIDKEGISDLTATATLEFFDAPSITFRKALNSDASQFFETFGGDPCNNVDFRNSSERKVVEKINFVNDNEMNYTDTCFGRVYNVCFIFQDHSFLLVDILVYSLQPNSQHMLLAISNEETVYLPSELARYS